MLNFLLWFVVGPLVGWLAGKLMRTGGNPWLDAAAGLVGAIVVGTACDLVGFTVSNTLVGSALSGAAGALAVTVVFRKLIAKESDVLAKPSSRKSYTSYKSRMGK
jgi:uncharacterized membrane protein YeaQ/YmgE (transglycosylase-associated protein family)